MKNIKYIQGIICLLLCIVVFKSNAQKVQFSVGRNFTTYKLINTSNQEVNYLKPGSGYYMHAGINRSFLDSVSLQVKSSEKALRFSQKPGYSKLLSLLTYSAGVSLSQLNASGDIQQIPLKYETDYIGAQIGLGAHVKLIKRLEVQVRGTLSASKLIGGNQQSGNNFYSLVGNSHFDGIKLFKGFQIDLHTRLNNSTNLFLSYAQQSTLISSEASTGKLDFNNKIIAMGLEFQIN